MRFCHGDIQRKALLQFRSVVTMTFTVMLSNQADQLADLLQLYYPQGCKILDFTYGKGALWWRVFETPYLNEMYKVTACDAISDPKENTLEGYLPDEAQAPIPTKQEKVNVKNIFTDDYSDLGKHELALFDPPYLLGRNSFDYSVKVGTGGMLIPMQYQGPRSWGASDLARFTRNQDLPTFLKRVECIADKAPSILKPKGILIVKVLDVRNKGHLIPHHINITNIMQKNFELIDTGVYIRQGSTTWRVKGHLQNLNGFWLAFQLRDRANMENGTLG